MNSKVNSESLCCVSPLPLHSLGGSGDFLNLQELNRCAGVKMWLQSLLLWACSLFCLEWASQDCPLCVARSQVSPAVLCCRETLRKSWLFSLAYSSWKPTRFVSWRSLLGIYEEKFMTVAVNETVHYVNAGNFRDDERCTATVLGEGRSRETFASYTKKGTSRLEILLETCY